MPRSTTAAENHQENTRYLMRDLENDDSVKKPVSLGREATSLTSSKPLPRGLFSTATLAPLALVLAVKTIHRCHACVRKSQQGWLSIATKDTRRQVSYLMLSHHERNLELPAYSSVGWYLFASLVFVSLVHISIFLFRLRMVSVHFNVVKDFLIFQTIPPSREDLQSSQRSVWVGGIFVCSFDEWLLHI